MSVSPAMQRNPFLMQASESHTKIDVVLERLHLAVAVIYTAALPLATAPHNIAFGLLVLFAAIRWRNTAYALKNLSTRWVIVVLLMWCVVTAASVLWTNDVAEGLEELKAFRVILLPLLLLPLWRYVKTLLAAFLVGVLVQNGIQCAQYFEIFGQQTVKNSRAPGLLHVTQTATMSLVAACFYLAILARGRGLIRWLAIPALAMACLGLVLTGSRGPWLAGAVVLPIETILLFLTIARSRTGVSIAAVCVVIAGAAMTPLVQPFVNKRIDSAVSQYEAAKNGDYRSDVGLKYANWMWATRFFQQSPIIGIGAGAFRDEVRTTPEYASMVEAHPKRGKAFARAHPHSSWLHVLSATGIAGFAPFLAFVLALVTLSWRVKMKSVATIGARYAVLAWLIGAQFDTYHGNGHQFGLLMLVLSILLMNQLRSELLRDSRSDALHEAGRTLT